MVGLSARIGTYVAFIEMANDRKKELYKDINDSFLPEFERIKSKLPNNYLLQAYHVSDTTRGFLVSIDNPIHNGRLAEKEEVDRLNEKLKSDFDEIKQRYGFDVEFNLTLEL